MKILAVDTATESCSVAVVQDDVLKAEFTDVSGQTHSRHLMHLIDSALDASGIGIHQMDGLAVTRGPGSFTGLRIGISVIKGLAMAIAKPVVGVSCLEALAWQTGACSSRVYPLMDARRNELYFAGYRWIDGKLVPEVEEQVGTLASIKALIRAPSFLVGSGCVRYKDEISKGFGHNMRFVPFFMNTIRAATVAYIAQKRLELGAVDDIATFTPVYLRKSDAEVNRERGL